MSSFSLKFARQRLWPVVRILWIVAGILFLVWQFRSFQARGFDVATLNESPGIYIAEEGPALEVMPVDQSEPVGLIFYPGGMVEPRAYLPLAHALATRGYPVIIVKLPYRSAPLAEQEAAVHDYVRTRIAGSIIAQWAVGGHSRGGALAARFVYHHPQAADALILIGTTHPKEAAWSLADRAIPVTKIYGTVDGIASPATILANRTLLPADTAFLPIEGGNHSQFGYYGPQLGDGRATISREAQQAQLVDLISDVLESLEN
jgi:pimeloyl-ACP methyl ester carboxylesterase